MAIFWVKSVSLGQIGGQNSLFLIKIGDFFESGGYSFFELMVDS
jgi:hypothetical protein